MTESSFRIIHICCTGKIMLIFILKKCRIIWAKCVQQQMSLHYRQNNLIGQRVSFALKTAIRQICHMGFWVNTST